jgi:hypothetical protein
MPHVTANIGGIASKLGNRYEAKWLVRQLLDVLGASAAWVKYEGIGEEFLGFEFALHRRGRTEWHQAKTSAPNGNWTVRALGNEGVLSSFRARLQANDDDICVFVSQDPVKDLRNLTQKAGRANSQEEFDRALTDPERNKIAQLERLWSGGFGDAMSGHTTNPLLTKILERSATSISTARPTRLPFSASTSSKISTRRSQLSDYEKNSVRRTSSASSIGRSILHSLKDSQLRPLRTWQRMRHSAAQARIFLARRLLGLRNCCLAQTHQLWCS